MSAIDIRLARASDLDTLSAICLRSKAHWGYDAAFLEACREELTVRPADLDRTWVAHVDGAAAGVAQLSPELDEVELLYIDPAFIGHGLGRVLMDTMVTHARAAGRTHLRIEADPNAAPFYRHMGAVPVGAAPSGSIPGRTLPVLSLTL